MEQEDLTASHWDDVISPNSGSAFGNLNSTFIPPALNNEFNGLSLHGNDHEPYTRSNSSDSQENDADGNFRTSNSDDLKQAETEQLNELKKQERKEHKHQLLSELTHGSEDNQLEASVISPEKVKPSESLFNDKDSPIKVSDKDSRNVDNLSSPRRSSQLKNSQLYKTPRPRKFSSKTVVRHLSHEGKNEGNKNPLGPLGNETDDSKSTDKASIKSIHRAELLVQEVNSPLYEITKKSEKKELAQMLPKSTSPAQSPVTNGSGSSNVENKENLNQLEITVGDPMKVGDITNAHIVYTIKTKNKNPNATNFPKTEDIITVSRRYKDFRWIYHQLQNNHPGRIIPPPPTKQTYIGRFNENFIENRRLSLEKMLNKIGSIPILSNDPDFIMFLVSEDFANESKERERLSGSAASMQNNEFLDNENGVGEESSVGSLGSSSSSTPIISGSGGFMSSLFSISNKINEPDEYFANKKAYMEDLECNLKNFYKSIELIGSQRLEMINLIDDISLTIEELASLEISKVTSDLLNAFSEVQMKLKENMDRVNLQDQLTLGFTIEEYLRIIGSIKFVFETRSKIYQQYYTYNQDLSKKQSQLDKLNKKYKMQVDKINQLTFEVDKLKQKSSAYEKKFNLITETIKSEIEKFEIEKIDDFRNSVEIFIESSIEAQKEAIELWETFYERQNLAKA